MDKGGRTPGREIKISLQQALLSIFGSLHSILMSDNKPCPKCHSDLTYPDQNKMVCTQCFHEWDPEAESAESTDTNKVLDANGNELKDGDAVIVIKDLPVKGASKPIKAGTKVKNIRLTDGDHNIACKIEGFGAMGLKSEFVKKV